MTEGKLWNVMGRGARFLREFGCHDEIDGARRTVKFATGSKNADSAWFLLDSPPTRLSGPRSSSRRPRGRTGEHLQQRNQESMSRMKAAEEVKTGEEGGAQALRHEAAQRGRGHIGEWKGDEAGGTSARDPGQWARDPAAAERHVGRSAGGRTGVDEAAVVQPGHGHGPTPDPRTSQQPAVTATGVFGKRKGERGTSPPAATLGGQRRRQALDSTIRRGRWPIMLLPEVLDPQAKWHLQSKSGLASCHRSVPSRWRTLLHQINGEERVPRWVLDQLVKRTQKSATEEARKAGASNEARYMISDAAWQQAGFSPPNNKGTKSSNDEDDNREPKPYDALPAWCEIVVAVHSDRLRNETSAKSGLVEAPGQEWTRRARRLGARKAKGGGWGKGLRLTFPRLQSRFQRPPRSERGGDGGNSNVGAQIERKAEEAGVPVPAGLGSLLSSGLLSRLHEQMNKGNNKPAEASTDTPADGAAIDRPSKEELSKIMSRTIVVAADETQTIEGLVREVGSRGLAIVEYPCLELWDAKSLRKDVAKKGTEIVELASNDLKRKRKRIDEEISDDEDASAAPRHPAAKDNCRRRRNRWVSSGCLRTIPVTRAAPRMKKRVSRGTERTPRGRKKATSMRATWLPSRGLWAGFPPSHGGMPR
ncbi:hypothetical protein L7F22_033115 [Adiantum nelumboides]|nr:hypothetical protein [Adiantum nelumboides]